MAASASAGSAPAKRSPYRFLRDGIARAVQSLRQASGWLFVQWGIDVCYVVAVVYVCLRALFPDLGWYGGFGAPRDFWAVIVVLALLAGHIAVGWLDRRLDNRRPLAGAPLLFLAAMAASAVALGISAYGRCHGPQTPFFAPLGWTLALFVGEIQDRFDSDACADVPVALDIATLLAIATTLSAALAIALTLFRSQLDRFAIARARSVTVVVGVDDDSLSMIRAIAHARTPGTTRRHHQRYRHGRSPHGASARRQDQCCQSRRTQHHGEVANMESGGQALSTLRRPRPESQALSRD